MIINENLRPKLPDHLPFAIKVIIEAAWSKDPNDR